jgi:protein-S-isoprenylcysteine O-methyltransferase Ste14
MNLPAKLGLIYVVSELALSLLRRSNAKSKRQDGGSLTVLWVTITAAMTAAAAVTWLLPQFSYALSPAIVQVFGTVFAFALVLRWWSIISLGKFFTVDVAIAQDHRLIIRGPYHWMRHPSYTGMLLAFLMLGATFQNWISIVCVMVPISIALAYRIYVEEIALEATFGSAYHRYAESTKRLIPGVF